MAENKKLTPKDIDGAFIINWCKEHGQVEWLKREGTKTQTVKRYHRKFVTDENGKRVAIEDKSREPKIKEEPVSFLTLRNAFIKQFMPEISTPKKKEKTFHDLINEL